MTTTIACNSNRELSSTENVLLLDEWETPYNIAPFEQIKADHYIAAVDRAVEELNNDIKSIVENSNDPTFTNTIAALDSAGERLRVLKDLFEMSEASISTPDYQRVSQIVTPQIASTWDAVYMNEELFNRVKAVVKSVESPKVKLSAVKERLLSKIYDRFVKGGAELSAEQKERLAQINAEIVLLSTKFTHNLIAENDSNYIELDAVSIKGIPQAARAAASEEAKRRETTSKWVFTLSPTSVIPVLTFCEDRSVREKIYKAYYNRGANGGDHDNQEIVKTVTALRQERAAMLGYKSHAEYVISDQMAGSAEAVYKLLDGDSGVWGAALQQAKNEREELIKLFKRDNKKDEFEAWDWLFYAEKLRSTKYSLSNADLSNFFSLSGVRTGMFTLANRLYGIYFRPTTAPIYDPDCTVYEVFNADHTLLGVLYLDLYVRPTKGQGAWCGNLREQSYNSKGERILPVVAIVCNFPRPVNNEAVILTPEQIETLFHEFGHALHFLMQDVKYRNLASVEGDFVEFPSQVMENWAFEPEMLRLYAVNLRTGKPMSDNVIKNLARSREFNQGYETLSVLSAALLDLDLQSLSPAQLDTLDVASFAKERLYESRGLIEQIGPRYQLSNFAHLFSYDYSAGYYFYLWSEILDKELFQNFKNGGDLFSKDIADRFRHEVLERGGERSGKEMIRDLIGREPSPSAMLKARGLK